MSNVNVEWSGTVPDFAVHDATNIKGFFGDYRYLSNFYPCLNGVWWGGTKFPAVEHAYQAAKFDKIYHKEFVDITASESKKLAKMMVKEDPSVFVRERWDLVRYHIMADLVFQKFTWNPHFQSNLVSTGNKFLEETNSWHDYYWGFCNGQGQNKLGIILMKVRDFWR